MQDEMRKVILLKKSTINYLFYFIRLHHACALQRVHLVQLYLSCLDFNIEAKDCEGNTCLHYVAITGNLFLSGFS
jgi:ankyrin repeat protein